MAKPFFTVVDSYGEPVAGSELLDDELRAYADEVHGTIVQDKPFKQVYPETPTTAVPVETTQNKENEQ